MLRRQFLRFVASLPLVGSLPFVAAARPTVFRWTGGAGTCYWNDPRNWDCGIVPGNTGDHVFIPFGDVTASDDTLTLDSLTIGPNASVSMPQPSSLFSAILS